MRVGIIGVSGYTGVELLRYLMLHPAVNLTVATARSWAGRSLGSEVPWCGRFAHLTVTEFDAAEATSRADLFFVALPHGSALEAVASLVAAGGRVVDLSADYRFRDPDVYQAAYGLEHPHPSLTGDAVYGLPELRPGAIAGAKLVANPGCFPTGTLLGLLPGIAAGMLDPEDLVSDALSGVTGAGKVPSERTHFPRCNDSVEAYQVTTHRHRPEMVQELSAAAGRGATLAFTPHLVPMNRGMLTTLYARPAGRPDANALRETMREAYRTSPFMTILPAGVWPTTAEVRGTNLCRLGVAFDAASGRYIIVTAIDNLGKGAAGQAVQNMNLMAGLPAETGILLPPLEV
jgi:N-acetyl-gamma-glutamyl-phosphate reductase